MCYSTPTGSNVCCVLVVINMGILWILWGALPWRLQRCEGFRPVFFAGAFYYSNRLCLNVGFRMNSNETGSSCDLFPDQFHGSRLLRFRVVDS